MVLCSAHQLFCNLNKEEKNMVKTDGTPFPLIYISTGLKTLLTIRLLKKHNINNVGVDITGCGSNIIEYIFEFTNHKS